MGRADGENRTRLGHVGNVVPHQSASSAGCELRESNASVRFGRAVPDQSAKLAELPARIELAPARYQRAARPSSYESVVEMPGNAPGRLACKAGQRPYASIPVRCIECTCGSARNRTLLRGFGGRVCALRSDPWRHVGVSIPSRHGLTSRRPQPADSRGSCAPEWSRTTASRFRKPSAESVGERMGVTHG